MQVLKRFLRAEADQKIPSGQLASLIQETADEREQLKTQELLTKREDRIYHKMLERLEGYRRELAAWEDGQTEPHKGKDASSAGEF